MMKLEGLPSEFEIDPKRVRETHMQSMGWEIERAVSAMGDNLYRGLIK